MRGRAPARDPLRAAGAERGARLGEPAAGRWARRVYLGRRGGPTLVPGRPLRSPATRCGCAFADARPATRRLPRRRRAAVQGAGLRRQRRRCHAEPRRDRGAGAAVGGRARTSRCRCRPGRGARGRGSRHAGGARGAHWSAPTSTTWRPALRWADLVVCRAGAMTLAELAVCGRPAVLVPFPHATDEHQLRNARAREEAGAAVVLLDRDCAPRRLPPPCRHWPATARGWPPWPRPRARLARPDAAVVIAADVIVCGLPRRGWHRSPASERRGAGATESARCSATPGTSTWSAIGGIGMSGIAEVLLNLGFRVSGSDLQRRARPTRGCPRSARASSIGHGAEARQRRRRRRALVGRHRANPEVARRARARHPGDPPRRDAGRADAPEVRRRRRRLARQDHDHDSGGGGAGRRAAWIRRSSWAARCARSAATRVLGGGDIPGGRSRRERRLVPAPDPDDRGRHQHRPRARGLLPAAWTCCARRSPTSSSACRSTAWRCSAHDDPEVRSAVSPRMRSQGHVTYGLDRGREVPRRGSWPPGPTDAVQRVPCAAPSRGEVYAAPARPCTTCPNALAARRGRGLELGVPFVTIARALATFQGVGRRCESARRARRRAGGRRLRAPPHRDLAATMAVARGCADAASGRARSSRTAIRARGGFVASSPTRWRARTAVGLLPVYAAGEDRPRRWTASLIASRTAREGDRPGDRAGRRDGGDRRLARRPSVVAGDLLLTLGAGDIGRQVASIGALLAGRETP